MFWALPLNWFSVYVDNFDQGTIILRTLEKEYTFTSSGTQVALRDACGAVAGHDLYMVAEYDFDWRSLIKASLKDGEVCPSRGPRDRTTWRRTMQCFREGPVPVAVAALALKSAVLEHPWSLGHFVRLLPAGPARALAGTPELLPIHFPPFVSKAEEEAGSLLEKWVSGRKPLGEVDLELIHDGAVDAFLWLIVMALNYMYVGGPGVQWQCIRCPALHSPAQVAAVERLRTLATIMVDEGGSLNAMAWDDQRRPPEEYWGHAVQKAHALSWRAVEGSLPPRGLGNTHPPREARRREGPGRPPGPLLASPS